MKQQCMLWTFVVELNRDGTKLFVLTNKFSLTCRVDVA